MPPNQSTELWQGRVPGQEIRTKLSDVPRAIIVSAKILDHNSGDVLARYANWYVFNRLVVVHQAYGREFFFTFPRPEPFKYIHFPSPAEVGLKISTSSSKKHEGAAEVRLSCDLPIKGIVLDAEGDADVKWGDQAIDLVPGDEQIVLALGLDGREVKARYLGDGSA